MSLPRALLVCLFLFAGCVPSERLTPDVTEDVGRTAGDDLARLKFAVEDLAASAGDLTEEGARETAEACHPTVGDCELCFELDGGYLSGAFVAATPDLCGASWELRGSGADYSVQETALSGTWSADSLAGDYTISASGSRAATLSSTTPEGSAVRTADWTLSALTATTVGFALSTMTVDLSYTSFGDHTWQLSVDGDGAGPIGSLVLDDGSVSCTIAGTWEAPSINCL